MIHISCYTVPSRKQGSWVEELVDLGFCDYNYFISSSKIKRLSEGTSWVLCLEKFDDSIIFVAQSHLKDWNARLKVSIPIEWRDRYFANLPDHSLLGDGDIYPASAHIAFYSSTNIPFLHGALQKGLCYRITGDGENGRVFTMFAGTETDVRILASNRPESFIEAWNVKPIILLR